MRLLLILALIFTSIFAIYCQNWEELSQNGTCDFYPKCLEAKYKCGPKGYPIGYGFKYCSKFVQYIDEFPPQGQQWIRKTLVCLKQSLIKEFTNCQQVFNAAFDSHPQCYYQAGFCDLFLDSKNITKTIQALLKVYEIQDFASATSMKQIFQTAQICGTDYMGKLGNVLKEIFHIK
jgi:hypothetical protein